MGRNNKDFKESAREPLGIPGFEGTMEAFDSLMKSGQNIIDKRKPKPDEK